MVVSHHGIPQPSRLRQSIERIIKKRYALEKEEKGRKKDGSRRMKKCQGTLRKKKNKQALMCAAIIDKNAGIHEVSPSNDSKGIVQTPELLNSQSPNSI